MVCVICKKSGHDRRNCPALNDKNPTELELQLRNRRYALDAVNSVTELLKVPMVTAGVWAMLSRNEPTLGVLNKAILAAELAPIIGDIKFPEGVLLGAAIESTEDLINILNAAGVIEATFEALYAAAVSGAVAGGGQVADVISDITETFVPISKSCFMYNQLVWGHHLDAIGKREGPGAARARAEGTAIPLIDSIFTSKIGRAKATVKFALALKAMKKAGCERPTYPYYSPPEQWAEI